MPAGPVFWPVYIATRWSRTLTWYASLAEYEEDPVTAARVDLTGYTATAIARRKDGSTAASLTLTTANDSINLGGTAGTIALLLGGDVTSDAVEAGLYVFDFIFTDASANVLEPTFEGRLEFKRTVTLQ
tara:strand:- start:367 stop:753 length:387 start_codon:yes stop_codon:yes gene_type:complete